MQYFAILMLPRNPKDEIIGRRMPSSTILAAISSCRQSGSELFCLVTLSITSKLIPSSVEFDILPSDILKASQAAVNEHVLCVCLNATLAMWPNLSIHSIQEDCTKSSQSFYRGWQNSHDAGFDETRQQTGVTASELRFALVTRVQAQRSDKYDSGRGRGELWKADLKKLRDT